MHTKAAVDTRVCFRLSLFQTVLSCSYGAGIHVRLCSETGHQENASVDGASVIHPVVMTGTQVTERAAVPYSWQISLAVSVLFKVTF